MPDERGSTRHEIPFRRDQRGFIEHATPPTAHEPPRTRHATSLMAHETPSQVDDRRFFRWDGNRYVWVPGSYVEPPHAHARWVDGHWAHRGGGWVWVEGHWR